MTITKKMAALNLNVAVPRSSKDTLAGIAHLPRMIDKARALRNDTLGEYIYPCPLDWYVLNFLAMDAEDFADLAEVNDDGQMAAWADESGVSRTGKEKDLLNAKIFFLLCGIAGVLYLLWPYLMWMVKVFIYNLILDYGFYILIFMVGGGYYLWRRLKS